MCDNLKTDKEGVILWEKKEKFCTRKIVLWPSPNNEEGDYGIVNTKTCQGRSFSTVIYLPIEAIESLKAILNGR